MSNRLVYYNGKFVAEKDANISIYDSALMFGDMVFEMTRSFNQKQFKLREHLHRLYTGINILEIPISMTLDEMYKKCLETVEVNKKFFNEDDEHRLMINVSRGPLGIYAPIFDGRIESTIIIADFPLKYTVASVAKFFDKGINLVIPSQRAIPAYLMDPKIKNRSRMWYQIANLEVSKYEGNNNWALLIDTDGFIAEGTGDNFFMIKDNKLFTPEPRNILRGITRDYIFELSTQLNLDCIEKNIEPYDIYEADEAFVCATPFCILPVQSLNGKLIQNSKNKSITDLLIKTWSKNVGVDIVSQIKRYSREIDTNYNSPTPYQFHKK